MSICRATVDSTAALLAPAGVTGMTIITTTTWLVRPVVFV
jgi:hypothetical protein